MSRLDVTAVESVWDFFLEAIDEALGLLAFHPSEATERYLVDLLCQYASVGDAELGQPLAPLMARTEICPPRESVPLLKRVGDQSLVVAGFFSDSLGRFKIDTGYYVFLGQKAYLRLSRLLRVHGRRARLVIVFSELGEEFSSFTEVLRQVRRNSDLGPPSHSERRTL